MLSSGSILVVVGCGFSAFGFFGFGSDLAWRLRKYSAFVGCSVSMNPSAFTNITPRFESMLTFDLPTPA
jgi:hypothetical protein